MDTQPDGTSTVPIACTLDGTAQAGRVGQWRHLLGQASGLTLEVRAPAEAWPMIIEVFGPDG